MITSVAECRQYYQHAHQHHTHDWVKDYYRMDRLGYQVFIIPKDGVYKFTVFGAGHGGSYRAHGTMVEASFYLRRFMEITLIVGQQGKHPKGVDKVGAGGSFVVMGRQLLIAAGGAGAWNRITW